MSPDLITGFRSSFSKFFSFAVFSSVFYREMLCCSVGLPSGITIEELNQSSRLREEDKIEWTLEFYGDIEGSFHFTGLSGFLDALREDSNQEESIELMIETRVTENLKEIE